MFKPVIKNFFIIIIGAFVIVGCTNNDKKIEEVTKVLSRSEIMASTPESIGAAINVGREILISYQTELDKAQSVRKTINLGVIATALYTAIGLGTGVHLGNIVVSTALAGALKLAEPNFQPNGSPESLGSAMSKTICILRAAEVTQHSENLAAVQKLVANGGDYVVLNEYESLKSIVLSSIMQVNIDQAISNTPALLDGAKVADMLKVASEEEQGAEIPKGHKETTTATAQETVKITTKIVNDNIKSCLVN